MLRFEHHKPATEAGQAFSCSCAVGSALPESLHVYAYGGNRPRVTLSLLGDVGHQSLAFSPTLARAVALRLVAAADALEG